MIVLIQDAVNYKVEPGRPGNITYLLIKKIPLNFSETCPLMKGVLKMMIENGVEV